MSSLNDTYVSTGEAARVLGMHRFAVQRLIHGGRLPAERIANRWFIPRKALEELAKTYVPRRGRPRKSAN